MHVTEEGGIGEVKLMLVLYILNLYIENQNLISRHFLVTGFFLFLFNWSWGLFNA